MKEDPEKLLVRFGKSFEASANGRFAIVALVVVVALYFLVPLISRLF